MMYTAQEVARYVVNKCATEGHPISNLQLQKILYFLQVGSIRAGHGIAFGDEMEAWQFGPVVPIGYYQYGRYGAMPITDTYQNESILSEDQKVLDPIIEEKRVLDAWDLVEESHREGGPWSRNYGGTGTHRPIPLTDIEQYG